MPTLPDTLEELLIGFASMAWSTATESVIWDRPDLTIEVLTTQMKCFEPSGYCTVINCTFIFCTTIWIAFVAFWSWCNGYRCRKWTQRHKFKSWMRLIAFHIALIPLGKVWIQLFSLQLWVNNREDWVLQPWWGN